MPALPCRIADLQLCSGLQHHPRQEHRAGVGHRPGGAGAHLEGAPTPNGCLAWGPGRSTAHSALSRTGCTSPCQPALSACQTEAHCHLSENRAPRTTPSNLCPPLRACLSRRAAASSAPASWTASSRPSSATPTSPTCWSTPSLAATWRRSAVVACWGAGTRALAGSKLFQGKCSAAASRRDYLAIFFVN